MYIYTLVVIIIIITVIRIVTVIIIPVTIIVTTVIVKIPIHGAFAPCETDLGVSMAMGVMEETHENG